MVSEKYPIKYPQDLPVCEYRDEIKRVLSENQVIIVCGDTGSGKTTQLPKMALELGFGDGNRRIACTQPRRLATVTVANRVAEEFGGAVGELVGYQHRYDRKISSQTRIKFMTDGVLLAETRSDPLLRAYDCIIIDEAHERTLNIDFLLGILKRTLARRDDLKVVVSSATLDTSRFAEFFGGAPTLTIPGRRYPVSIRYQEPTDGEDSDLVRDAVAAVETLPADGDILIFLAGERDIRDVADGLVGRGVEEEIIPLISSLPASEQRRAFRVSTRRRIILATNVAETSVTIPGIRYVIDSGLARISRYVHRTQVQRLQVEKISRASAQQRAGRCGRLGPGVCIRLYSEADFLSREEYSAPEILRTSLAGVILAMLDLRLGDVADFPFISPPAPAMIREGLRELLELGAIKSAKKSHDDLKKSADLSGGIILTKTGRALARFPVEPRLARMLLAAQEEHVMVNALTVVAAMACDDPRRRPAEERQKAESAHAKWKAENSDFATTVKLWQWWEAEGAKSSQGALRKLCKANFLSFTKMREWLELRRRLEELAKRLGLDVASDRGGDEGLRRALLAGLLGRIGHFDGERLDYRGCRGVRFSVSPGSCLFRKKTPWIMAGSLVETSRLYAVDAAAIDPEWIEAAAGDLCKHSYNSPQWDAQSGFVRASEQVTLYGIVIVSSRRCDYSRIDPKMCREIFIRRGLIEGEFPKAPGIVRDNFALIASVREREDKLRVRGLLDEERLAALFDEAMPVEINNADALRRWLRSAQDVELQKFRLKASDLFSGDDAALADFPDYVSLGKVKLPLSYRHSLDVEEDGITCDVRRSEVAALRDWQSDWLVPGALPEKLIWMLGSLPSQQRRALSPLSDTVTRLMTYLKPGNEPLVRALSRTIRREFGIPVRPDAWDGVPMPPHFLVRFRIKDDATGRRLATSRDKNVLLERFLPQESAATAPQPAATSVPPSGWIFGTIPAERVTGQAGWAIRRYPALHDDLNSVSLREYSDAEKARRLHQAGLSRLFVLVGKLDKAGRLLGRNSRVMRTLPVQATLYLKQIGYDEPDFSNDFYFAVSVTSFLSDGSDIRSEAAFAERLCVGRASVGRNQAELAGLLFDIITLAAECDRASRSDAHLTDETFDAVQTQLSWLVYPGFVRATLLLRLRRVVRYLEGVRVRLERAVRNPALDAANEALVKPFWERYRQALKEPVGLFDHEALADYRWMVEEYRISLFAQELRTLYPVSPKRLEAKWEEVVRRHGK